MRWELNDLARRLDKQAPPVEMDESIVAAPAESGTAHLGPQARRILAAIETLPQEERGAFDLVRIQEITLAKAAEVLGVAIKTVQRRLNRALFLLTEALGDLRPAASKNA